MRKLRHHLYNLLTVIFLLYSPYFVHAQVSATAKINKQEIRIGDPIQLTLSLHFSPQDNIQKILWPSFKDTITKHIEIIEAGKLDTIQKTTSTILQQSLSISAYDSGQFVLPSIKFYLNNDTSQFVQTPTLLITVHTVPTDTAETSIKDIKPILEEKFDFKWYMPLIIKALIALVVLAVIIFLLYYYLVKKKHKEQKEDKPKLPPHVLALQNLQKIKEAAIWKEGKVKEYYSAVADTIRQYIEDRYNVQALEKTSFETLQDLKFKAIDRASREKLKYLLELSDLVKFAKFLPVEQDHHNIIQSAIDFVNETKIEDIDPSNQPTTNNPTNSIPHNYA